MKRTLLILVLSFISVQLYSQNRNLSGRIIDSATQVPINGVTIVLNPGNRSDVTDETGRFFFKNPAVSVNTLTVSAVGYQKKTYQLKDFKSGKVISIARRRTLLTDVVITADNRNPYKAISETDIKLRGVSNSQEVLRIVPGLFIGQHQGGGKAEQIFLRGFDNDHGTDINMSVDGMPINMVSQAHGQGYSDSHFIIPETIETTTYQKGMYNAEKGDMAVTGFVNFNTANAITSNMVKVEAGQFNTYRVMGMANLLGEKAKAKNQSWYAASEYRYSDSYFDNP